MNQRGFTIMLVVGRYDGFYARRCEYSIRLVLGWVAVVFMNLDVECALVTAIDGYEQIKREYAALRERREEVTP